MDLRVSNSHVDSRSSQLVRPVHLVFLRLIPAAAIPLAMALLLLPPLDMLLLVRQGITMSRDYLRGS
jgi:hypothetical protein